MKKHHIIVAILTALCFVFLFSAAAEAASKPNYSLYADFLKQDEFTYKLKKKADNGLSTYGLTFYDRYGSARYERKSISFCLIDLNGDGTKELIVGRMASNWTPKAMQLYVFTIKNNKVSFVKYLGANDYSFRANGQKVQYSRKYKALYCPSLEQNSDAYYDDETETWSLYQMKGTKMTRIRYADSYLRHRTNGLEKDVVQYHIQSGSTAKVTSADSAAFAAYVDANLKNLDLKSYKMYQNNAKNRKKLLGKA